MDYYIITIVFNKDIMTLIPHTKINTLLYYITEEAGLGCPPTEGEAKVQVDASFKLTKYN